MFETSGVTFKNRVDGTWGTFHTTAGKVNFILTKARLGKTGTDQEKRLMNILAPVREVLPIDHMNFNQLLQRDLDDHRIAIDLIPYVLETQHTGPAYFPPIVAIILPFEGLKPIDFFPKLKPIEQHKDIEYNSYVAGDMYGETLEFVKLVAEHGEDHKIKLGRVSWNDENAKLVVMDGQHRAMALIAINRTINASWRGGPGEKYETFYSGRVREYLSQAEAKGQPINLEQIEFPVNICWFPDGVEGGIRPHQAARKLFVDINQNAKKPSQARLILLSDTKLVNIFTRELLNSLRREEPPSPPFPLYAIEYDNPDSEASRPARWSVLANLDMLYNAVLRCAFGPKKYLQKMDCKFGGKPNDKEMNSYFRECIGVKDIFPEQIDDGPRSIARDEIENKYFPVYNHAEHKRLIEQFMIVVGNGLLYILGNLYPYKAHIDALIGIYNGWSTSGSTAGQLAKDALFEGMGVFWTIRDGHTYYLEQCKNAKKDGELTPTKPEVSNAWNILDSEKKKEFMGERARVFLGLSTQPSSDKVDEVEKFYGVTNTQACQLGAFLTWGTLCEFNKSINRLELSKVMVEALNKSLISGPVASRDRRLIFSRDVSKPLNLISKLDTPVAVYYRYFWLELLCTVEAKDVVREKGLDIPKMESLRDEARKHYWLLIVSQQEKAIKQTRPELATSAKQKKLRTEAKKQSDKLLKEALKFWFGTEFPGFANTHVDEEGDIPVEENGDNETDFESLE
jgi:hypothetical protein